MTKYLSSAPFGVSSPGTTNNYRNGWDAMYTDCAGCFKIATRVVSLEAKAKAPICQHCYDRLQNEKVAFDKGIDEGRDVRRPFYYQLVNQCWINSRKDK